MIASAPERATKPLFPPSENRWLNNGIWRISALLLLFGVLIVNHGCHGHDVDDELSATPAPHAEERSP